jgi:CRP-like cAMP-binding protein
MLRSKIMTSAPREVWGDLAVTAFVESSPLFRSLDPDARCDLLQMAQLVTCAPGEPVSAEGEETFVLLVEGSAALQVDGAEVAHLNRGATFGEGRALGIPLGAALTARTEVTAVVFPVSMIAALAERFPRMKRLLEAVRVARDKEASSLRR